DPRDVFIGRGVCWKDIEEGARIGTSALRRRVQLLMAKPGLEIKALRGNVDTRLRRLERGDFEGLVLAAAGLRRLGRGDVAHELISTDVIVPAPGQGALAIEARKGRQDVAHIISAIDHAPTRREVELERAFLAAVGGGCSTPLGALARTQTGGLRLTAFWSREDGQGAQRLSGVCPNSADSGNWAAGLADEIKR
ncbi:MAG: hydroxymethylbilane synthase, partial [Elusimicrobia bacterium RIFCSPHIGHO2_02_FULL_57_9]